MAESSNIQIAEIPRGARFRQSGMTLLELLIAITVLSIGMLGASVMIVAAMKSDARNRNDTAAVVLDQEILERFATYANYPKSGTVTVPDCGTNIANNVHLANVAGAFAPGNGAALTATGDIDWTQPAPTMATPTVAGYAMDYQTCNGDTYEVRWNVTQVDTETNIAALTVSSRQIASANSNQTLLFSIPTTLRTIID
jgi:prepilin-type N-terminal cleavage/methylation domain-containing protein